MASHHQPQRVQNGSGGALFFLGGGGDATRSLDPAAVILLVSVPSGKGWLERTRELLHACMLEEAQQGGLVDWWLRA